MKRLHSLLLCLMLLATATIAWAQQDKSNRKSPPAVVSKEVKGTTITIDYSRPYKRGRAIFGSLERFGKVWRTGAKETSWIEFSKDVQIGGKSLAAGKYGLFTIPGEEEWVVIFNKVWEGWGAYEYKESEDALRVVVPASSLEEVVEQFTIDISDEGVVRIAWDQTEVAFEVLP